MTASHACEKPVAGLPLQVICYERADDIAFGVSGVVTRRAASARRFRISTPARSRWPRR